MARERSIVVRLRAEVSDFQTQIGNASRSLSDFEKSQQKMGGAATTTMGRLTQSAKINEQAWSETGRTLLVAGGAVAGLGLAALKTGVQYNTLQQTTRAALTSITGSAEQANAQMDKLDEFASNSPFAKQVFLEAQQQMLGFGIEAQKVIPYLDSIQNAVAATGGSNQDIAELSRIFSTIHANAKITARDLMMFGQRGVDAATIIGDQMGKTGQQIRDEITAGTLDAGEALDALATGMGERFDGAAEGVKNTFAGAVDRVKAAWRDIGSVLATPLVNPDGGGLLIDFFNTLADAMRAFEGAPTWLQGAIVGIASLAGAAALAGGAFLTLYPRWVRFNENIQTLRNAHPILGRVSDGMGRLARTAGQLAGLGMQVGIMAAAIGALFTAATVDTEFHGLNQLKINIEDLVDAGKTAQEIDLNSIVSDLPTTFGLVKIEAENLGDVFEKMLNPSTTDKFADFFSGVLPTYMQNNREIAEELDAALVQMLNAGGAEESAAVQFMEDLGYSTEELKQILPGASDALVGVEAAAADAEGTADALAGSFLGIGSSADDAAAAMENWIALVSNAGESFGGILAAYDAVIEKQGETSASTSQTMEDWIAELQAQADAHSNWAENVVAAMEQANTEMTGEAQEMHAAFVEEMTEAGIEGAAALQTFVDATPEQRAELVEAWMGTKDDIRDVIEAGEDPQIGIDADTEPAITSFGELMDYIVDSTPLLGVDADTDPADGRVRGMLDAWGAEHTETNLGVDISPAQVMANSLMDGWGRVTTDTNLGANTNPALSAFQGQTQLWNRTTTDTNLDANTNPALRAFQGQTQLWNRTTTNTRLDANTSPASGKFNSATGTWRNTTTSTKIDADTSPAQRSWNSFKNGVGAIYTSIIANVKTGNYEGGFINPGKYEGGQILPGRQAGGTVPGPRAGRDNILWPLHSGGQILSQPLEGGEFVVRSSQAHRYEPELYAMNSGIYPTGTMERLYSSNTAGPMSVQVSAPPVDTAAIGAAVSAAMAGWRPSISIGGREFYGVMRETANRFGSL